MAATMGFDDLTYLTHKMENILDLLRNHKIEASSTVLDVVFMAVDDLEAMLIDIAGGGKGKRNVSEVISYLERIENGENDSRISETSSKAFKQLDQIQIYDEFEVSVLEQSAEQGYRTYELKVTVDKQALLKAARVFMVFNVLETIGEVIKSTPSVENLEAENFGEQFVVTIITKVNSKEIKKRILKVSEILSVAVRSVDVDKLQKTSKQQGMVQLEEELNVQQQSTTKETNSDLSLESLKKNRGEINKTIRVNIERLDGLMNLFEELVIERSRLEQIASELQKVELNESVERMSQISGDLQKIILNMRMMPVGQVFNRFNRMVRSLSKNLHKKVKLTIIGAETELDRTIVDEIGDPLVHLLRNSIDHGIETPDIRLAAGKSEEGIVKLKAYHSGNHVCIEIEDDGAGIDRDKVLKKALAKGIVSEKEAANMTEQQVFGLLFSSGLSTAEKVTEVSGRGVGLDVVRSTFEALGGVVTVNSVLGKGTVFSIQLPLRK
jgi:two-component system chemotaxis sensor kinase CheA